MPGYQGCKTAGRKKGPNHKPQSRTVSIATLYKGAVPSETPTQAYSAPGQKRCPFLSH